MAPTDALPSETTSLCPECLEPVPGRYEAGDDGVYLARECETHGATDRKVWDSVAHWEWAAGVGPPTEHTGDLTVENDHACLAVVEVTSDCNLSCSYCYASSGPGGTHRSQAAVVDLLETVQADGGPRPIQFSGGEPTVRDDLPDLVETARGMGFEHVQINSNGLRLAREDGYAERLADAGVTAIYLQFDGLTPGTYEAIREADILAEKREAIAACRRAGLDVVLVPTVVPGVNVDEMGDVLRFALDNLDVVTAVNFQPVAHFGRVAEHHGRFAIDEAARRLGEQVDFLGPRDLKPVPCCSSYCQLATALLPDDDGGAAPVTQYLADDGWAEWSGLMDEADWMEILAGTTAGVERTCSGLSCCGGSVPAVDPALVEAVLPVTIIGFMDADAADAGRLENCCISVPTPDGDLVPFCGYNMTTDDGEYALRQRHGWGGRPAVGADVPAGEWGGTDAAASSADDPRGTEESVAGDPRDSEESVAGDLRDDEVPGDDD